jgi:hypothetical protein
VSHFETGYWTFGVILKSCIFQYARASIIVHEISTVCK